MEETITTTKSELRRSMRERMRSVSSDTLGEWSRSLIDRLQAADDVWKTPGVVSLFGGLRNEPDLMSGLMPWLRQRGWRTVLFAVAGHELIPYEVTEQQDLQRGPLGIWEPHLHADRLVEVAALNVILVPALAFSQADGSRLGRGGGFYDRLLARPENHARRIGVAFEAQVLPSLTVETHDMRVHELVTDQCWRRFP